MHDGFVLGIDGGGTKTLAVIARRNGEIVGTGQGGSANFDDVGVPAARNNLNDAVFAASRQAGLKREPFAAAFLGIAGVVSARDRAVVRQMALDLDLAPAGQVGVDHDCRIALAGGLSGRPGIVLITGTGSSCYGRAAGGQDWRAGGWGYLLADEGSSYWLGLQAMRSTVMAYDGRLSASLLLDAVRGRLGLEEMNDIMHRLYVDGMSRSEIAALGPLVIQAARDGDPTALELIQQAARDLASCVFAVADRLGFSAPGQTCEIVQVGGMLKAGDIFLAPLHHAIATCLPHSRVQEAELPPVAGACLLALESLGDAVSEPVIRALRNSVSVVS